jgi:hypothetical protein
VIEISPSSVIARRWVRPSCLRGLEIAGGVCTGAGFAELAVLFLAAEPGKTHSPAIRSVTRTERWISAAPFASRFARQPGQGGARFEYCTISGSGMGVQAMSRAEFEHMSMDMIISSGRN